MNGTEHPSHAVALAGSLVPAIEERFDSFSRAASGALSPNTERALKGDIEVFSAWCAARGYSPLPGAPQTVAEFVDGMTRGDPVEAA